MNRFIAKITFIATLLVSTVVAVYGQSCPTDGPTVIEVCNNAGQAGTIRAYFYNGDVPVSYVLLSFSIPGPISDPFGPVTVTKLTSLPAGAKAGVEFNLVPDGDYVIRVNCADGSDTNIGGLGIAVSSGLALNAGATVDPDCNPATGGASADGSITLNLSGGIGPYDLHWPTTVTAIGDNNNVGAGNHSFNNLDGGAYTVEILDQNNCLFTLDIDVPLATIPDAGGDQTVCGFTAALAANAAGPGEIGTWTGPAGVTFDDPNSPTTNANNLVAGANVLRWTINDTGGACPATFDEMQVTVSAPMNLSTTVTHVLCNGASTGAIDLSITGGIAPYTFAWSNAANSEDLSNIAAGTYTVTVTDNASCTAVLTGIVVGQPATIVSGTTTQVDVACFGGSTGSITLTGSGGVGPYDFSIDAGGSYAGVAAADHTFTGLAAGDHQLMVKDANGCQSPIITVTVTEPATAVSGSTAKIDVTCFGASTGSITITGAGGVGPYDFSIDGGATYTALDAPDQTFPNLVADVYDLMIRDANGCQSPLIQVTITEPSAAVSGSTTQVDVSCFGASTGSITITGAGGIAPYDFSIDGGATYAALDLANHTFQNLAAATYDLTVRDANGCESALIQVTITEPATAVSGNTSNVDVLCFGASTGSITITGAGGVGLYDFSIDNGATYPVLAQPDYTFNGLPAGTHSLRVRDANGCETAAIPVTINQPAAAVSGTTSQENVLCFGAGTGSITITGSGGVAPYDFSIDGGTSYPVLAATTDHTFSNVAAGTYNLRVRDANGCQTAVIPVTITEPAAAVSGSTTQVDVLCFGTSTGSITITGAGGVAPYDFSIDGGATYPGLAAADHTFLNVAAGTYNLMVRDANGCQTAVIPVTITEPAVAVSGSTTQVDVTCFGASTGTITITGGGGVGPYDFSIDGGATYAQLASADHTFPSLAAGTYNLMVRDANGCQTGVIPVTITQPAAAVSGTTTQVDVTCFGLATGEISITGAGGVGPYDFSIDGGVTYPVLAAANNTFSGLSAGVYNLKVRDANSCESASIPVTITQPAEVTSVVSAVGAVTVCEGTVLPDVVFTFTGIAPFDFTYTDGTTPISISDHPTNTFTVATAAPGTYSVTALTDNNGCVSANLGGSITVTEETAPVADAGSAQIICSGQTATLSGSAISGSAATGTWSIISAPAGGDGVLSDETATATPDIVTFTASVAGAYTLRLTTDDPTGVCEAVADDVIITVASAAAVDAGPAQTICVGATATMAATFTGTTGIDWTTSGNGTFDDPTSPTAVYTPGAIDIANGTVTLTATTQGPCAQVLDDVVITIDPAPVVDAGPPQTVCSNVSVVLNASFGGSATGLAWTTSGNGSFNDVTDSNATYTLGSDDITDGTVTLTATATGSCSGTFDQVVITIDPAPTVDAGGPQTICLGTNVVLSATLGGSAVSVTWKSSGDGTFDNITDPNTEYTPGVSDLALGTVTLTAETNNPAGVCPAAADNVVVTFIPIPGDQTTAGNETWIGYVYDDAGVTGTIPDKIDFDNARYRGFITETDISSMTTLSSYDAATDAFDLNLDIAGTVHGPNLCNPLANDFSIRYKMSKTFNAGVYRFTVGADDGVRLLVDGVNVLPAEAFDLHSYATYTSEAICLSAAVHELEIHYFDNTAQSRLTFEIDVVSDVSFALGNTSACKAGDPLNLLSLVTPATAGGVFTFAGPGVSGNFFDASAQSGVVNINVDYELNGCTGNGTLAVTVLDSSDPLCAGGNCGSVVIIPKPEPATCTNSDGRLVMSIKPFKTTGTKITIDGISSTNLPISRTIFNDSTFDKLPVGVYNYVIEYGDPSCVKTGQFSIDQSGTVGTPEFSHLKSPLCFGTATGSLTLDVPGETGNVLEWSLDGGLTDPFKPFIAGSKITGIPAGPAPSFNQVISVRRNIADVCFSSITIPMRDSVLAISATFDITPATCSANDGAITGIVASGGNDAPFSYSLDGGLTFQASPEFNGLAGGSYTLRVRDAGGCESDFTANVTFPGFINSAISKQDADCSDGGDSGSITVMVTDPGVFEVALTTDQFNEPEESEYLAYSNPSVAFNSLPRGEYFVYLKSNTGGCATRSAPIRIFGVYDVTFDLQPDCNNNALSLALVNVTGDPSGPQVQIHVTKKMSSDPTQIIDKLLPANGEIFLDHDEYAFLQTPGAYDIKIVQLQVEVYCPMSSQTVEFTVPQPLSASIGAVSESYPDIATGNLAVTGFSGGVFPYDVRIELDSAASFTLPYHVTEFEEAGINENQQIAKTYDGVPAGRYKVEVMDAQGCVVDLVARVPLDADIFIPNVFTPNGDGSNDVFFIRNLPHEPSVNELIITNRWGKQIFTSENYQNNWDAEDTADGIYFYRLQIADNEALTGWVEVIRGPKP